MPERSVLYLEMLDALRSGRCALCYLGDQAADSYLRALIHEGVTDPGLRQTLRDARGLCNRHAWRLAGWRGSTVGAAIIYHDVVNTLARLLEQQGAAASRRPNRAALAKNLLPSAECPACTLEREAVARAVKTLLTYLEQPELGPAYQSGAGLCLAHFAAVLPQANDTQASPLEAWQLGIWRQLHAELGELIRKNDHRYQGEPVGEEADSWLRAIAAVAGPSQQRE